MNFGDYQSLTRETAIYPSELALVYLALGLSSEASEVAGKVKKVIRDSDSVLTDDMRTAIISEMGDTLWYLSELASHLGTTLENVASLNIDKLFDRAERGALSGSGDDR